MSYTLLIICSLAALSSNVIALDTESIISRMSEAKPVNYFVTIKRDDKSVCRGGIIGTWIVLTAASCVYDRSANDFVPGSLSVVAGYGNATLVADVEKIYVPKVFADGAKDDATVIGDIAVLKLKQNLNLRENRKTLKRLASPRKLRGDGYKDYLKESVKIATFDHDPKITLPYLLNAKVIDESHCVERNNRAVRETEICGKIEDSSYAMVRLCEADVGSPLVFNNKVVVGVALVPSHRCVLNGEPSVYTRVSSYVPFIKAARDGKSENALVKVL